MTPIANHRTARGAVRAQPSVVIVGAGFGGIAMALELLRAGFEKFTILERAAELGGVWRENTYPGAACDVPAPCYSFSFAPEPYWTDRFAGGAEIHGYMRGLVAKYGLDRHIRLNTEVSVARFAEQEACWWLETADGARLRADVLVAATGQLSRPAWPNIPGVGDFAGPAFHSAQWDHECQLAGQRVAVIGTGASAIQFVPRIQPHVAHLTLYQRSAPYVLPKSELRYSAWQQKLYARLPVTQLAERLYFWAFLELGASAVAGNKMVAALLKRRALRHLAREVADPLLRAKLAPDYVFGCKRVLFANDYYPALRQPNVAVRTEPIAEITPGGVRTADGVEHPADVLIYGTGFASHEFLAPMEVYGCGGRSLREVWAGGARAYLGMAVPEFPNLFLMYGPNTNLGSGSILYMLERQARYIRQLVHRLAARPRSYVEVSPEVAERFDREMQRRLTDTVWASCASWYREENGRVSANWPGLVSEYNRRTKVPDFTAYRTVPATSDTLGDRVL
ncbi:cation diffusion facilitator CzcD-associated flavoprotein CzcO [Tamaricihabitans halophyticus]|uniref:Cation diffusion facilitator CzcD-associated flavoprotein CzcO n=1 Tax=Tamaricihabitans halophyticus TaxID=1262583 RepID=A0A4R2QIS6_9PSEU|nr:NAD(P)/FAD-dependent oxidoreductase [Tamaricihabitans halophyticus]TCP49262.1 cation diffusion facilitator CzcD-associated flavoprotein CzcO [Tamaricihabitans halophyticus]